MVTNVLINDKIMESVKLGLDSIYVRIHNQWDEQILNSCKNMFSGREFIPEQSQSGKVYKLFITEDTCKIFKSLLKWGNNAQV